MFTIYSCTLRNIQLQKLQTLGYHIMSFSRNFSVKTFFFCHFIVTTGQKFNPSETVALQNMNEICIYLRILLIAVTMEF